MPIFDQGYQHWKGHLSGHAWRWMPIARHGMRTQFKAWYVRLLIIMAWMPAAVLVGVLAVWGMIEQGVSGAETWLPFLTMLAGASDLHGCRQAVWTIAFSYYFQIELYFIMLVVTLAGPNLISQDLRFNALPLYLSRPLTRLDYFLGKLGMIGGLVATVTLIPAAIAYVMGVCFSLDLSVVRDTWRLFPASIVYGMVIVVSAGTLMLALSSLSRRSLYVGLAWIAIWLVSNSVGGVLLGVHYDVIERSINAQELQADSLASGSQPGRRIRSRGYYPNEEKIKDSVAKAAKTDWRPLFSYPWNMERLGDAALNTDAAWVKIARVMDSSQSRASMMFGVPPNALPFNPNQRHDERRLADTSILQYPWPWSAGVLVGLFGLSLWIMSMRVRSLDRLR